MSQYKLTVAAKATIPGYASLIGAALVNANEASSPIDLSFVDDAVIEKDNSDSTVVLESVTDGSKIYGNEKALRFLDGKYSLSGPAGDAQLIDEWVKFAFEALTIRDFKSLTPSLEKLESHLNFRTFIVGYTRTLADIALWGVLRANSVVASVVKNGTFINIARWYKYFDGSRHFSGSVDTLIKDINDQRKNSKQGQKKESKANYDIDLVDAEDGKVVTRFPPEPSGYLHIGHAKAAVLNQYFAKMYHGKLIIRFDDTNPSKENEEFEDSIVEDLKLLGIEGDAVSHTSDYFQELYDLAVKLIKEGKAYCDDTSQEQMREERGEGIASARRDRTVEENLRIFEEMTKVSEEGKKNCVRAKISVDAPNKALRDPVIYRCNDARHHRTGDKWKVYPTYDFCCPIVDSLEGVTHALRTTEYRDRNAQYEWMLKAMDLRRVHIWDFSRVNFVRTLLSKRKLQWFVDSGKVSGWDDPRFPTVRGVRRRGMTVEGLQQFIIAQGPSKNILNLDWSSIWATNKKVIDPIVPRHSAVVAENAVKVNLIDGPKTPYKEERPRHKKNADLGKKQVMFASSVLIDQDDAQTLNDGEEFTFMDWGNAIIQTIHKDSDGKTVTGIDAKLHLEGDFKKTEKKLSWLADTKDAIECDLVDFDHLINKDKIEEGENFEDYLTPQTEFHRKAYGDMALSELVEGDIIQFERKGYYRLDKCPTDGSPAVFFTIPDGKVVQRYGAKPSSSDKK